MADEREGEEPVIRDKRRIDPETGKVRPAEGETAGAEGGESAPSAPAGDGDSVGGVPSEPLEGPDVETSFTDADLSFLSGQTSVEELASQHLNDLKRVTAEYANYRKRTDANREIERERAMGEVVKVLLPVLDDLDRADKHGDLQGEGAFPTIASKLRASVERLGLTPFGAVGDLFDPTMHEAIFQQPDPAVDSEVVADVVETGYYLGSHMLRAAKVVVKVPAE
ncbi:nucleotide exchange factor GrpE [Rathayibacter sp. YIM 133350]|uniref:nucleotide exchange factor GrpE n=1 Tax=Rathayibacter sp. YIM 133350 TaxID=3131992 RepID=UPI00307EBF85